MTPTEQLWSGFPIPRKGSLARAGPIDTFAAMKFKHRPALWRFAALWFVAMFACGAASAKDFKFQAMLIWATNAEKSPDPKHKPVSDEIRRKLEDLPLKWK